MANLDNLGEISKLDKSKLLGSIEALPEQLRQAWDDIFQTSIPDELLGVGNIVISGMGGSALGGRIVDSLILDRARTPIEVFTEFRLPNYVNQDTFVILASYSGNTEETLTAGTEALTRGASIFCLTTGGKLQKFMEENSLVGYIFDPKHT